MPPRNKPSQRQRRLGAELRKLRNQAGLSGDQAGALLDADRTRISNIEAGRLDVSRNRLYMLLREYGCPHGPLLDGLMDLAGARGTGWWDDFRDVIGQDALDLAELESRSSGIRIHEPLFIPGMLQTPEYARAVVEATGRDRARIDRYVAFRIARQRVLTAASPAVYHAVIHEAALRVQVGGPATLRAQLRKLIEVAGLPNVTIQIFPFDKGAYAAFSRPFILFDGRAPELGTVYLEHPQQRMFLGDVERMGEYARMFERLSDLALDPVDPAAAPESRKGRDSLSLIQEIMYSL